MPVPVFTSCLRVEIFPALLDHRAQILAQLFDRRPI
jgi:hypothetical protein